jgi:Tfp pilus assembly protein PilF
LTFNKDIAPIVFERCASCHRPGQSAPFSLLSYEDVKKRAKQIAEVTASRYMPPWLPEPGFGEFANDRRLTADQLDRIQQWIAEGAIEGVTSDLPRLPRWPEGWQVGKPDLILTMPQPYTLAAEGKDVYRNFVIPVPLSTAHYVRAVEFQPGNSKIVHHAFIKVDRTRQSRRLDGKDGAPGFAGMNVPESVQMPEGHFLAWQPGKLPAAEPDGLAWTLEKDADVVLQMHLRPTGRPETIQSSVGIYFTDRVPTNTCFKFALTSLTFDIPPGATNYVVTDDFVLPVDAQMLAVLPHAHYLAKEMQGFATLPDGTKKWLILIKEWDFNWQGDYRYATSVFLPRGTTLSMRYTYDNSTNNTRNLNQAPKQIRYGPQSADEMAELWFQLLPLRRQDLPALASAYSTKMAKVFIAYNEFLLQSNPADATAHTELGLALLSQGKDTEALDHFRAAVRIRPDTDQPHYYLGLVFRRQNMLSEATTEFEMALRLNRENHKAHGNLGMISLEQGKLEAAESHFKAALRINPDDELAREGLEMVAKAVGGRRKAN